MYKREDYCRILPKNHTNHTVLFYHVVFCNILIYRLHKKEQKPENPGSIKDYYFNSLFASKCTPLINNSTVPNSIQYVSTATFSFNEEVILKFINVLSINRAHGIHDISIWMIKLCSKSVVKPLSIIFKNCIDTGTFPDN